MMVVVIVSAEAFVTLMAVVAIVAVGHRGCCDRRRRHER